MPFFYSWFRRRRRASRAVQNGTHYGFISRLSQLSHRTSQQMSFKNWAAAASRVQLAAPLHFPGCLPFNVVILVAIRGMGGAPSLRCARCARSTPLVVHLSHIVLCDPPLLYPGGGSEPEAAHCSTGGHRKAEANNRCARGQTLRGRNGGFCFSMQLPTTARHTTIGGSTCRR